MIRGSCLCGNVSYQIDGQLGTITHCHCTKCRKAHGAAFSTVANVQINKFQFTSGTELLKSFESSPGKRRYFCVQCGSQIYAHREGQKHYILRLGTLAERGTSELEGR
ncbi:MAG: GFA family protein [Microcystis sp.]